MVLILLVDLDDTLLGNAMETFIPAYLRALGNNLSDIIQPEILVSSMLDATRSMFSNRRPDRTLKQTFDSDFYPAIGIAEESLQTRIDNFYAADFVNLKQYTQIRPEARTFIKTAFRKGYKVVIATNPLFPQTAILQRLEWAGFAHEEFDFPLIPSYETFHFAKPDPAFFAELLTRMGWPSGPILMIGNDPDHDVNGSSLMGIPSFWIINDVKNYPDNKPKPTGQGTLEEIIPWIDSMVIDKLTPDFNKFTAIRAMLHGVPAGISSILSTIFEYPWSDESEGIRRELSQVVCSLRDLEIDENLPMLEKLINGNASSIPTIDLTGGRVGKRNSNQDSFNVFSNYLQTRIKTLSILDSGNDHYGLVETNDLISKPTMLYQFLASIANREIELSRQIFELTNLLPATK